MSKAELYSSPILERIIREIPPEEFQRTGKRMRLAALINDAMIAKGWGIKDFAQAMGKKPSLIARWLSGAHNFTADTLFDIERVLNMHIFLPNEELQEFFRSIGKSDSLQPETKPVENVSSMNLNEDSKPYNKV